MREARQPRLDRESFPRLELEGGLVAGDIDLQRQQLLQGRDTQVDLGLRYGGVPAVELEVLGSDPGDSGAQIHQQRAPPFSQPPDDAAFGGKDVDVRLQQPRQFTHGHQRVVRLAIGAEALGKGQAVQGDGEQQECRRVGRCGIGPMLVRSGRLGPWRGRLSRLGRAAQYQTKDGRNEDGAPPRGRPSQGPSPGRCRRP